MFFAPPAFSIFWFTVLIHYACVCACACAVCVCVCVSSNFSDAFLTLAIATAPLYTLVASNKHMRPSPALLPAFIETFFLSESFVYSSKRFLELNRSPSRLSRAVSFLNLSLNRSATRSPRPSNRSLRASHRRRDRGCCSCFPWGAWRRLP